MDQLLKIAATVAAVQLLFAAWREWCAARRIVAVDGLDAEAYAVHGCVPLQFAGSRYWVVRAALAVTGFFMVGPRTRKQVFAACRIVGVHDGRQIDYCDIRPRDRLRIMLDEGEHLAVFDRSMRRGVVNFYRTVAIRDIESPGSSENAHCVTVRTRGDLLTVVDEAGSQWLEYEGTSAAPRSNRRSGPCSLADVPEDAVEVVIIPPDTYQQARDAVIGQAYGVLRRRLMRHNPNPRVGLVHVAARFAVPLVILASLGVRSLGWTATARILAAVVLMPMALFAILALVAGAVALGPYIRDRMRGRRPPVPKIQLRFLEPTRQRVPLSDANQRPPRMWTGATARAMGAGRDINATDARSTVTHAWRQYAYGFLPPRM